MTEETTAKKESPTKYIPIIITFLTITLAFFTAGIAVWDQPLWAVLMAEGGLYAAITFLIFVIWAILEDDHVSELKENIKELEMKIKRMEKESQKS